MAKKTRSEGSRKAAAHLIVGVGASAGGLEAFQQLVSGLQDPCGLSLVFVQHLAPQAESLMAGLMAKKTSLKVVSLKSRAKLAPNTIYIAPPQGVVEMSAGAAGGRYRQAAAPPPQSTTSCTHWPRTRAPAR